MELTDSFDLKAITSKQLLEKVAHLETAYVTECRPSQLSSMEGTGAVNKIRPSAGNFSANRFSRPNTSISGEGKLNLKALGKCSKCGRNNHIADKCKFKNATCFSCGKTGHVSTVCSLSGCISVSRLPGLEFKSTPGLLGSDSNHQVQKCCIFESQKT